MDQDKIGKFIAKCRKEKNMTQQELSERLGVSDRTIGNWENGRNMPDLSLFKPLCKELDITLNDLISGEKIEKKEYNKKLENNIVNTINYSKKEMEKERKKILYIIMIMGIIISITAIIMFDKESSWGSIYSIVGIFIFSLGLYKTLRFKKGYKKIGITILAFLGIFALFYFIDMISVISFKRPPIYSYKIETGDREIIYHSFLYNVYRINRNTINEYYIVDVGKRQNENTIPYTPFNREKSGIENIINYKNEYVGNNWNVGELIANLPLSEFGSVFQIDSKNCNLTINYNTTDWYNNHNMYIQRALVYNSISFFILIDNLKNITFNFSGSSYSIDRETIQNNYPNYNYILKNGNIDKNKFNNYVENKMNDLNFVDKIYKLIKNRNL